MDNSKDRKDNMELRSEKVRKLLGEIPSALVDWGIATLLLIIIVLLIVVCFVPYPHSNGESILSHLIGI
ncbi:MAG: hypothetical protein K2J78_10070 [Muribaculaceae bacterium]|nr:hypothetical protein [Muribaculaceae bacterium]